MRPCFRHENSFELGGDELHVHYGCGVVAPEGWENFDASPRLCLEQNIFFGPLIEKTLGKTYPKNVRYGDIVRGLPIRADSVDTVYCSHVLEHLSADEAIVAIDETWRILKPGGLFRLVVPDLFWRAKEYVERAGVGDPIAADDFLDNCLLGRKQQPRGNAMRLRLLLGRSAHFWMYDEAGLRMRLEKAGFASIRRCTPGDSANPIFLTVEKHSRFFEGTHAELAMEATKKCPRIAK